MQNNTKVIEPSFETFNPRDYLEEYYSEVGLENSAILEFLVNAYKDLPSSSKLLEFGGGPTIYPLIAAAPRVKEIHFAEYLTENLREVELWRNQPKEGFNWNKFIMKTLKLEGYKKIDERIIRLREKLIRKKLAQLLYCNAFMKDPISPSHRNHYDVINTNFVTESITSSKKIWEDLIGNICSMLKKHGVLIMTAIKGAEYYRVGSKLYPAVSIDERDLVQVLVRNGFYESNMIIETIASERTDEAMEDYQGYKGMVFVKAQK